MKTSFISVVFILCFKGVAGRFLNTGAQGTVESSFYGRAPRKSRASMPMQGTVIQPESQAWIECVIRRRCTLTRKPRSLESSINGRAPRKARALMPTQEAYALPQRQTGISQAQAWIECLVRNRCPNTRKPRSLKSSIDWKVPRKGRAVMSEREAHLQCLVRRTCHYTRPIGYMVHVITS